MSRTPRIPRTPRVSRRAMADGRRDAATLAKVYHLAAGARAELACVLAVHHAGAATVSRPADPTGRTQEGFDELVRAGLFVVTDREMFGQAVVEVDLRKLCAEARTARAVARAFAQEGGADAS